MQGRFSNGVDLYSSKVIKRLENFVSTCLIGNQDVLKSVIHYFHAMKKLQPFHLAIPVNDLARCREFYRDTLGCAEGRSSDHWVDFDFFGHQLVIHLAEDQAEAHHNPVDGHQVPVPHFGVVLEWKHWHEFADRLKAKEIDFAIAPYLRFEGLPGEQATLFFYDPSGNALEFKAFKNEAQLFAK